MPVGSNTKKIHVPSLMIGAIVILLASWMHGVAESRDNYGTVGRQDSLPPAPFDLGVKVFGQPAAAEWIDLRSYRVGEGEMTYVVPPGKAFMMDRLFRPFALRQGLINWEVSIDGELVVYDLDAWGTFERELPPGYVALPGQTISLRVPSSTASENVFILRGWLESTP